MHANILVRKSQEERSSINLRADGILHQYGLNLIICIWIQVLWKTLMKTAMHQRALQTQEIS